jgi:hypothetical protein
MEKNMNKNMILAALSFMISCEGLMATEGSEESSTPIPIFDRSTPYKEINYGSKPIDVKDENLLTMFSDFSDAANDFFSDFSGGVTPDTNLISLAKEIMKQGPNGLANSTYCTGQFSKGLYRAIHTNDCWVFLLSRPSSTFVTSTSSEEFIRCVSFDEKTIKFTNVCVDHGCDIAPHTHNYIIFDMKSAKFLRNGTENCRSAMYLEGKKISINVHGTATEPQRTVPPSLPETIPPSFPGTVPLPHPPPPLPKFNKGFEQWRVPPAPPLPHPPPSY